MISPIVRMCMVGFLLDFAVMAAVVATPFFVFYQLGGDGRMSGYIAAAQAVTYALTSFVSSRFVARAGNSLSMAIAGVGWFMLFVMAVPFSRSPLTCALLLTAGHFGLAFAWPALHAWVGGEPDLSTRARAMGWFNIAWSTGFALSPLLAGPLYDLNYRLPFALSAGASLAVMVLILSLPSERAPIILPPGAAEPSPDLFRERHDRTSELLLPAAWCGTLVANALAGVTRSVFPKRIDDLVSLGELRFLGEVVPAQMLLEAPATKYSWLAFLLCGATALTFWTLGNTQWWRHRFWLVLATEAMAGGAFFALGFTRNMAVMALCFVTVGVLLGLAFFSAVYYSMANPGLKHSRAAVNEAAVGAGGFLGHFGFGYLAGHAGILVPFRLAPLFIAAAIAVQLLLLWRARAAGQAR
jgi:MFS family permease